MARLYNTQLLFDADGVLIQRRRKISPTYHERMIWGMGDGSGLRAVDSAVGSRRPVGVLGALQPAGSLRVDGGRRADPFGDVSRLVRGRPFLRADCGQHPSCTPWSLACFVVNATAWLNSDQQAQIHRTTPG